jgi:hypothetical protein
MQESAGLLAALPVRPSRDAQELRNLIDA